MVGTQQSAKETYRKGRKERKEIRKPINFFGSAVVNLLWLIAEC